MLSKQHQELFRQDLLHFKGLRSNAEIGRELGLSGQFIGKLLSGKRTPSENTLKEFCATVGLPKHRYQEKMFNDVKHQPLIDAMRYLCRSASEVKEPLMIERIRLCIKEINAIETALHQGAQHVS